MRFELILFIIFVLGPLSPAGALALPDQTTVDQWIGLAHSMDAQQIKGQGAFYCHVVSAELEGADESSGFEGRSDSKDEAAARAGLACLKHRCQNLGAMMAREFAKISSLTDEDLSDYMQGQGFSVAEQQQALKNRKQAKPSDTLKVTCQNGTPLARALVFDTCFGSALICANTSSK